jgi:hypothetical protein
MISTCSDEKHSESSRKIPKSSTKVSSSGSKPFIIPVPEHRGQKKISSFYKTSLTVNSLNSGPLLTLNETSKITKSADNIFLPEPSINPLVLQSIECDQDLEPNTTDKIDDDPQEVLLTISPNDQLRLTSMKAPVAFEQLKFEAIPNDQISRVIKATSSPDFMKAQTWREQVGIIYTHLRDLNEGKRVSFKTLASFFNIPNAASVEFQWHQYQKTSLTIGRPTVFSSSLTEEIRKMVLSRFKQKNPITIIELVDYIQYRHHRTVTDDTMRHFISRIAGLHTVIGIPMEAERVISSDLEIIHWYQELSEVMKNIPAGFIFNMD